MKFIVKVTNKRSLNTLFSLADIDKGKVEVQKLSSKDGFSFELFGKESENFIYIIKNTDITYSME